MKLIEAMKLKKELQTKAEDIRAKIKTHSAHMDFEGASYGSQAKQQEAIDGWLQSHQDIVKQIRKLAVDIQRTNLNTLVLVDIGGEPVELSIAECIIRRRELANMEKAAWELLTDKGLRDGAVNLSNGEGQKVVKVVRYFDPAERDKKVEQFKHEPAAIDRKLEVVNAVTDLIEA